MKEIPLGNGLNAKVDDENYIFKRLNGISKMKMKRRKFLKTAAGTGIGAIVTGCTKDRISMGYEF